jgi:monoterpene epsilon-lactone hydrolase
MAQNPSLTQNITTSIYIPPTISKQAQEGLKNLKSDLVMTNLPQPDDLEVWKKLHQEREAPRIASSKQVVDTFQANVTSIKMDNVSVLDIKSKDWVDNGKVLVYTHGGGYTQLSANSTLGGSLMVANTTGLRIISIDYTLAPFSKWNQTTDQVLSVIHDLKTNKDIL